MNDSDRLTAHNESGEAIVDMTGVRDELEARARIRRYSPLIIAKLTAYEDTGLSPEEVEALKAENAELRARLEKSVELPCKIGDVIFEVVFKSVNCRNCEHFRVVKRESEGQPLNYCYKNCPPAHFSIFEKHVEGFRDYFYLNDDGQIKPIHNVFLTREEAEARLAELKGDDHADT